MEFLEALQSSTALALWTSLLVGLCAGSFLNVVILRYPQMLEREWHQQAAELRGEEPATQDRFDLVHPRSRCPACGHRLRLWEIIPLLGWVLLRGRCSACGTAIGLRYPLVELLTGALSVAAIAWHGVTLAGLGALLFTWCLIALAFIDLDTQLLPDDLTLPLLWLGLIFNLWGVFTPLEAAVVGAVAGYLSLWSVYWLFRLLTGREGMGFGDFKLLAAIGAWFGWQSLPAVIVLASAVGALVGITLIVLRRHARGTPIPFGPYLAGAGLLAMYIGRPVASQLGFG
jgi:leader peptidase (prepilin peptidase)/N-methyltransferase